MLSQYHPKTFSATLPTFAIIVSIILFGPYASPIHARETTYIGNYEVTTEDNGTKKEVVRVAGLPAQAGAMGKVVKSRVTGKPWEYTYYTTDIQGSTRQEIQESVIANKAWQSIPKPNTYYAYGSPITSFNAQTQKVEDTYTGQRKDEETNLMYYNARYYNPTTGLFLQADSVDDGKNKYQYVASNPVNNVDPSGHECIETDGTKSGDCDNLGVLDLNDIFNNLMEAKEDGELNKRIEERSSLEDRIKREVRDPLRKVSDILSPNLKIDFTINSATNDVLLIIENIAITEAQIQKAEKSKKDYYFTLNVLNELNKFPEERPKGFANSDLVDYDRKMAQRQFTHEWGAELTVRESLSTYSKKTIPIDDQNLYRKTALDIMVGEYKKAHFPQFESFFEQQAPFLELFK